MLAPLAVLWHLWHLWHLWGTFGTRGTGSDHVCLALCWQVEQQLNEAVPTCSPAALPAG